MYYFFNAPKIVKDEFVPDSVLKIIANKSFTFCAIFNESQIFLYDFKTASLLSSSDRSVESVDVYGINQHFEWSPDSTIFTVATSKGFLLLYSFKLAAASTETGNDGLVPLQSFNGFTVLLDIISFNYRINCLCMYRDDLIVSTDDGSLNRIKWDGRVLYSQQIKLGAVSFFTDLEFSKVNSMTKCDSQCFGMEWFPSLSGLAILFQNGRAAFLHIPKHKLITDQVTAVWAENLRYATCFAVNIKFRSIAFGGKMGDGVVYNFDDETGALRQQHRLKICCNECPDAETITGAVISLKWTPDYYCLAMCWKNKGFSLWSAQGFLLFSSLRHEWDIDMQLFQMDWGIEGYSLWAIREESSVMEKSSKKQPEIMIYQFAKAALLGNQSTDNQLHVLLLSSSSFFFGRRDHLSVSGTPLERIDYPESYINANWPIKVASVNRSGSCFIFAGKKGFAVFHLKSYKWRLFGNETQEQSMEIVGGAIWFKHLICLSCYNNKKEQFELRLYDSSKKIDDESCFSLSVPSQVLIVNIYDNIFITLSIDGLVSLYSIHCKDSETMSLQFYQIISLESYIEFSACVISLNLSSLHSELTGPVFDGHDGPKFNSLLVNYSGHLLMFQRDKLTHNLIPNSAKEKSAISYDQNKNAYFTGPIVVAYNVEVMWTPLVYEHDEIDWSAKCFILENTLWLNCGIHGLRVWLPLNARVSSNGKDQSIRQSFLSKRIMLTCKQMKIYPLVVLNSDGILISVSNDFFVTTIPNYTFGQLVVSEIVLNTHVFFHHIIKQLLRINLGAHALELTLSMKRLAYFNHTLEMLVHEVLEEEATSKEPIPDPLLPRVIAFIQEFPHFLSTIVRCARKTELALWPYLFESAGNPKDLFENCIMNNELETAASYLIILQSTESSAMSQNLTILLLESALKQSKWPLVRDLIRFLKSISKSDLKSTENSPGKLFKDSLLHGPLNKRRYRSGGGISVKALRHSLSKFPNELDNSKHLKILRKKSNPLDSRSEDLLSDTNPFSSKTSEGLVIQVKDARSNDDSAFCTSPTKSCQDTCVNDSPKIVDFEKEIDSVVTAFGHSLFQTYQLQNLAEFVVNVNLSESQFITWLIREKLHCSVIKRPLQAFLTIHEAFNWPLQDSHIEPSRSDPNISNNHLSLSNGNNSRFTVSCHNQINTDVDSSYILLNQTNHSNKRFSTARRKLKYISSVMMKAEYWQWAFILLIMLGEFDEIHQLLYRLSGPDAGDGSTDSITNMFAIIKDIASWPNIHSSKYSKSIKHISDTFKDLFERHKKDVPFPLNLPGPVVDGGILSPTISNSLKLGRLEIVDKDGSKTDLSVDGEFFCKPDDNISRKSSSNVLNTIDETNDHSKMLNNNFPVLNNNYSNKIINTKHRNSRLSSMSESKNSEILRRTFDISELVSNYDSVICEPLVSTELEPRRTSTGCFLS